jgi:GMP synthase-like glutamine amidotransferase
MDCAGASKIILPGVGNFGQMLAALDRLKVRETLVERIRSGVPFLGICLGLQALFESGEEAPEQKGLGIFSGVVRRCPPKVRVPQMGWNVISARPGSRLLAGLGPQTTSISPTVITHRSSRRPPPSAITPLPIRRRSKAGNICGVQFHPEKSVPWAESHAQLRGALEYAGQTHHSLSRRHRWRVVKGVHFVNLRDAGEPWELAARYKRAGRR